MCEDDVVHIGKICSILFSLNPQCPLRKLTELSFSTADIQLYKTLAQERAVSDVYDYHVDIAKNSLQVLNMLVVFPALDKAGTTILRDKQKKKKVSNNIITTIIVRNARCVIINDIVISFAASA